MNLYELSLSDLRQLQQIIIAQRSQYPEHEQGFGNYPKVKYSDTQKEAIKELDTKLTKLEEAIYNKINSINWA